VQYRRGKFSTWVEYLHYLALTENSNERQHTATSTSSPVRGPYMYRDSPHSVMISYVIIHRVISIILIPLAAILIVV
jgi:hypothetical protein